MTAAVGARNTMAHEMRGRRKNTRVAFSNLGPPKIQVNFSFCTASMNAARFAGDLAQRNNLLMDREESTTQRERSEKTRAASAPKKQSESRRDRRRESSQNRQIAGLSMGKRNCSRGVGWAAEGDGLRRPRVTQSVKFQKERG